MGWISSIDSSKALLTHAMVLPYFLSFQWHLKVTKPKPPFQVMHSNISLDQQFSTFFISQHADRMLKLSISF